MGFGSYDESEQERQELNANLDEDDAVTVGSTDNGEVRFEYGEATSDDLLERLEEIKHG